MHQDKSQKVKSCRFGEAKQGKLYNMTATRIHELKLVSSPGSHECVLLSASSEQERDSWIATLQKNIPQGLVPADSEHSLLSSSGTISPRGTTSPRKSPRAAPASPRSQANIGGKLDFKKVKEHASNHKVLWSSSSNNLSRMFSI